MSRKSRRIAGGLALPLLLAACAGPHSDSERAAPAPVTARVATVQRVLVPETVEIQGTVEARQRATIAARVMAVVTAVHVVAGEPVAAGQLLLELDPAATAGQLAQARGGLDQARATLDLAERNAQRFDGLAAADAASELEVDQARHQLAQARAAVAQAEGAVAVAGSLAGDARVTASFAGRVQRRMVEVGDLAAPGRPLLTLESEVGRRLIAAVPESVVERAGLATGASVPVTVDARPELGELAGVVVERSAGADPMSHTYELAIALPAGDLPTGATGRAWIQVGERWSVSVPRAAVHTQGGLELVVLRGEDGTTSTRVVTTGRSAGNERVEVLSGLAGDESVLVGLAAVPPTGSPIREAA